MANPFTILSWRLARGRHPQAFLDAPWVGWLLQIAPASQRRRLALRLLSLSPHYLAVPGPDAARPAGRDARLEAAFAAAIDSRSRLFTRLLAEHVRPGATWVDYGCGYGCMARAAATQVGRVYGVDVSSGALACARVLNSDPRIEYLTARPDTLDAIPDASVDLIYSIALAQHLTADRLDAVLSVCRRKLAAGGTLLLHLVIDGEGGWRPEPDWERDRSLRGRLRYQYGLHCFMRSAEWYRDRLEHAGFHGFDLRPVGDYGGGHDDDIRRQHVAVVRR